MKRVLHVLRKLDPGGVEMWLLDVVESGGIPGCAIEVLVETKTPGALEPRFVAAGVRVRRWTVGRLDQLWNAVRGCHAVHAHVHGFSGVILAVAAAAGVPVRIAHSHTVSRANSFYLRAMRRLIEVFATARVAVSGAAAQSLFAESAPVRQFACPKRIPVCGVAPSDDGIVIGHVGRIVPEKNHQLLELLLDADAEFRLLLCGEGPDRARLARHPRIRFVAAPEEVYAQAACFAFPSLREGLGLALIEAQAAGLRCVVSSRVPPEARLIPELIDVVDPEAPLREWATAVRRSAALPRLPDSHRRVREAGFDLELGIRVLEEMYAGR